ncbi:MAG: exonuclease domain-containing protein [Bradymonadia bacterium]
MQLPLVQTTGNQTPKAQPGVVQGLMARSDAVDPSTLPWWPLEGVTALCQATGRILAMFDLETAGGPNHEDGIVEIHIFFVSPKTGALREAGGLVNPERPISPMAMRVHGIRDHQVRHCPNWLHWAPFMHDVAAHHLVSGYNVKGFDCRKVLTQNARYGHEETVFAQTLDTMHLARTARTPKGGLGAAARALEVPGPHAHRARDDALMTLLVLDRLLTIYGLDEALGRIAPVEPKLPGSARRRTRRKSR